MNIKKRSVIHPGTCFILVIFILLCLVAFGVLSISNASSDYELSIKTAEQTTLYYKADKEAKSILEDLRITFRNIYLDTSFSTASQFYEACLKTLSGNSLYQVNKAEDPPVISYEVPIDSNKNLLVSLKLTYPQTAGEPFWTIHSWQSTPVDEWVPDDNEQVFDGTFPFETQTNR